jgi:multiple sugar transport system substrate-binding protein
MNRREFLRASATLAAGIALASCAPSTPEPADEPEPTAVPEEEPTAEPAEPEQVELTLIYWEDNEGPAQANGYMEEHPEVTIELIPFAGEDAKMDSMIAAGTPPDFMPFGDVNWYQYYVDGVLLNLQPLIDADEEFSEDDYFAEILDTSRNDEGDLYCLGPDFGAQLLWYNKSLFDEAGLPYPDEDWTWQDHKDAAAAITAGEGAEKVYGTMPHNWWAVQIPLVWQNNGEVFSESPVTCLMDSDEAIGALDYMVSFVRDGTSASPGQLSGMGMETGQLFAAGRVGLFPGGHWESWQFADTEDFEWDVTAVPKNEAWATWLHQAFWGVSATTAAPEVAWDWLKFTAGPKWSEWFCAQFGGMSTIISVAEKLATSDPLEIGAAGPHVGLIWKALYRSARGGRLYSRIPTFLEVMDNAWGPTVDELWNEDITPAEAGLKIKEIADPILETD